MTILRWTSSRTTGSSWETRSAASMRSGTGRTSANISERPPDADGLIGSTTRGKKGRIVRKGSGSGVLVAAMLLAGVAAAKEHPGKEYIERNGYRGPSTCEAQGCHPGTAKEFPASPETGKTRFTGCNTCHPGNHISDVGSAGKDAENAIDCLICHASRYDFR